MPESVGKTLKKIRESKQLSLEEVSERTRTPKKILSAIEEDRLHEISEPFYVKGFIKSYSQFLGALEQAAIRQYLSGAQKKESVALAPRVEKAEKAVTEWNWEWLQRYKQHISAALVAIFAIWLVFFSFAQLKKFVRSRKVAAASRPSRANSTDAAEAPVPAPVQVTPAADSEKKEGVELEITARYNTWIQVTSNGKLLFKGILEKGARDTWQTKKEINLEVGNAGAVILKLNGKDLGSPGRKGEKKTIVVTEDGIR